MALLSRYWCSNCDVSLPDGGPFGLYVLCENGERRHIGPEPDAVMVQEATGLDYWSAYHRGLVGQTHSCICMACARQLTLDLERDVKRCEACGSLEVRTVHGAVGATCPSCKTGTIESEAYAVT